MNESKKKRGDPTGFDGIKEKETAKRLSNWNHNQLAGRWRTVRQAKIRYTYIKQTWTYHHETTHELKHISPLGMVHFLSKLLSEKRNRQNFSVLPVSVIEAFSLEESSYDPNLMSLECTDEGDMGYEMFYFVYCSTCLKSDKFIQLVDKHKN